MPDGSATLDISRRTAHCDDILADWLRSAEERFGWLKHVTASAEVNKAAKLFAKPSGHGRSRARIALQRALAPCGTLHAIGDGRLPYIVWAAIRPRPETSSVALSFVAVLRFENGKVTIVSLFWSANVQLAALADAIRHGEENPDRLLLELHAALLDAPEAVADVKAPLSVPAGRGHFVGQFVRGMAEDQLGAVRVALDDAFPEPRLHERLECLHLDAGDEVVKQLTQLRRAPADSSPSPEPEHRDPQVRSSLAAACARGDSSQEKPGLEGRQYVRNSHELLCRIIGFGNRTAVRQEPAHGTLVHA